MTFNFTRLSLLKRVIPIALLLLLPNILFGNSSEDVTRIKNIDEFESKEFTRVELPFMTTGMIVFQSKIDGRKYFVKKSSDDFEHDNKNLEEKPIYTNVDSIADFLGAFILKSIIGDRAPVNYFVKLKNGRVTVASKSIENFKTVNKYMLQFILDKATTEELINFADFADKGCKGVEQFTYPPKCRPLPLRELYISNEYIETFRLFEFISNVDHHNDNVGLIIRDGKIVDSAVIDLELSFTPESLYQASIPFNIRKRYYSGLENALKSLKLISSFDVDSLDELNSLFDELGRRADLNKVKNLLHERLLDINQQIQFCELAKKIISGEAGLEEVDQLITMDVALDRLTIKHNENILMNVLYEKKDLPRIAKCLQKEPILIPTFVRYCLKHGEFDPLNTVSLWSDNLSTDMMDEILKQSQNEEHLEMLLKLMENWNTKLATQLKCFEFDTESKEYILIKRFLDSRPFDIGELLKDKSLDKPVTFYERLANKLLVLAMFNPKIIKDNIPHHANLAVIKNLLHDEEDNEERMKIYLDLIKNNTQLLSDVLGKMIKKGRSNIVLNFLEEFEDKGKLNVDYAQIDAWCEDMASKACVLPEFKNKLYDAFALEYERENKVSFRQTIAEFHPELEL